MKFSIVTCCLNQRRFVARAIESVLSQDYPEIEYVVVDPGSTDGSREIIERYGSDIDRVIFEPDLGQSDGSNKALESAAGDFYGCINADDFYLPGALTKAAEFIHTHPRADVVYGHGFIVDADSNIVRRFRSDKTYRSGFAHCQISIAHQSTFYRAEAFRAVGGFEVGNGWNPDLEVLFRMWEAGYRISRMRAALSAFTIHPASITGSNRLAEEASERRVDLFRRVYGNEPQGLVDDLRARFAWLEKRVRDPVGAALRVSELLGLRVGYAAYTPWPPERTGSWRHN